jgi:ketosteroid isomerase-like protein
MVGRDEFKAESGDTAINEWSASGTHQGPLETPEGTIPATGKQITIRGCDVVTVRDGRITSHRAYFDQLSFMAQLGLLPEEAAAG